MQGGDLPFLPPVLQAVWRLNYERGCEESRAAGKSTLWVYLSSCVCVFGVCFLRGAGGRPSESRRFGATDQRVMNFAL